MNNEKILKLIEEKKYTILKEELKRMKEADIAEVLEEVADESLIKIFRLLSKDQAADVFSELDIDKKQLIINSLTLKEAAIIVDNMYADDAADLMEELPANVVNRVLMQTTAETRKDINTLLMYPEDSAGSIMTVEIADLKENDTVKQAINKLKKVGVDSETIDYCYVLDSKRTLIGIVSLKQLLFASPNTLIKNIMVRDICYVNTLDDQEVVAQAFQKYNLTVMPVVDKEDRLVGVITIDDIVDILEEETTEDIEKMAGIVTSDKPYMKTGVFETWKKRIPWLLLLMISATFTGRIISSYESALATYVILTSYIPMFMDTAGNAGGQVSVTIIRGLSLNEIKFKDVFSIIFKEFRVGILIGLTLAIANFAKLILFDKVSIMVALVVCLTLIITVVLAKLIGCILPILAKKLGFDPAVMASPFITTIVDACSLIIYFKVAVLLLHI
ncbi:MAG: magnesium transporter [Bacilli bacterium]